MNIFSESRKLCMIIIYGHPLCLWLILQTTSRCILLHFLQVYVGYTVCMVHKYWCAPVPLFFKTSFIWTINTVMYDLSWYTQIHFICLETDLILFLLLSIFLLNSFFAIVPYGHPKYLDSCTYSSLLGMNPMDELMRIRANGR